MRECLPTPFCLWNIGEEEVVGRVEKFLADLPVVHFAK
jgi:hypothetical protein